ncbi:MAG: hypothetical protein ACYCZK_01215 [Microbacteriaceae bacterium]
MKIVTSTSPVGPARAGCQVERTGGYHSGLPLLAAGAEARRLRGGPRSAAGQEWEEAVAEANTQVLRNWLQQAPGSAKRHRVALRTADFPGLSPRPHPTSRHEYID